MGNSFKNIIILMGLFWLHSICVYAAGPIMHAYLGLQWLELYAPEYDQKAKKEFLVGTLFPDIRYISSISRDQTHFKTANLEDIQKIKSPFEQGLYFHSYVDNLRWRFLKRHSVQKKLKPLQKRYQTIYIKLVEDQVLFEKNNWLSIKAYLADLLEEEKQFKLPISTLSQWHLGLTFYFSALPSTLLSQISMFDKGILMLDAETVKKWSNDIKLSAQDPDYNQYVSELIEYFNKEMKKKP